MEKKAYEKPELKGEKLFEAGAKTCCKTKGPCDNTDRDAGAGKQSRDSITS